ncbi:MAG: ChrR family anti-sigma-E factor [Myxococcota bacterium]
MTIEHHSTELLLAYATGAATSAEALVVACHLTLCGECRERIIELEALGGAFLESSPADTVSDALLSDVLARLDDPEPDPSPAPRTDPSGILPAALCDLVGPFADLSFQTIFPGVGQAVVPMETDGMPVRLFKLAAGTRVPDHRHEGLETTLVLTGGFTDDGGHYGRGDLCLRDDQHIHRQRIDPGEPCVVLTLADNPLVPLTLRGRVASWLRKV